MLPIYAPLLPHAAVNLVSAGRAPTAWEGAIPSRLTRLPRADQIPYARMRRMSSVTTREFFPMQPFTMETRLDMTGLWTKGTS